MSQATALQKAQALKAVLLAHGVPEVSIELMQGRPVSGDRWDSLGIVTNFFHHTVSSYKPTSLTPVLALCKKGRTDVPGPLCNGYGGWDLCYRIITFGYANHPGEGGPISVPRSGGGSFRIPKDSARKYAWGTEFEGGITEADWDRVLKNPRNGKTITFREFMGRVGAGVQDYFNVPLGAHLEHLTWAPRRKTDRKNYTQAKGIAEIKKYGGVITAPPSNIIDLEDLMAGMTPEQFQKAIYDGVAKYMSNLYNLKINGTAAKNHEEIEGLLRALIKQEADRYQVYYNNLRAILTAQGVAAADIDAILAKVDELTPPPVEAPAPVEGTSSTNPVLPN